MKFIPAKLSGVVLIQLEPHEDSRGFFLRTYCEKEFAQAGLPTRWVQCNHTATRQKGAIRGLHFQAEPFSEAKIVRCIRGKIFDVVVDLRKHSPTFGQWESFDLSETNFSQLYIPKGFAHGFQTETEDCHIFYQMSEIYHPESSQGIRWNDRNLSIEWPIRCTKISKRDSEFQDFQK